MKMPQSAETPERFEAGLARCELVKLWQNRMWRASLAHYVAADTYRIWHAGLTLFNVIAGITVLFLSNNQIIIDDLSSAQNSWLSYLLPIASLLTVLSSVVHYTVRFQERAEQHKQAGNEFSSLKRSIEREVANKNLTEAYIDEISRKYDAAALRFPHVPRRTWTKCMQKATKEVEMSADAKRFWAEIDKPR